MEPHKKITPAPSNSPCLTYILIIDYIHSGINTSFTSTKLCLSAENLGQLWKVSISHSTPKWVLIQRVGILIFMVISNTFKKSFLWWFVLVRTFYTNSFWSAVCSQSMHSEHNRKKSFRKLELISNMYKSTYLHTFNNWYDTYLQFLRKRDGGSISSILCLQNIYFSSNFSESKKHNWRLVQSHKMIEGDVTGNCK